MNTPSHLKCPNCGAMVASQPPPGAKTSRCQYCGMELAVAQKPSIQPPVPQQPPQIQFSTGPSMSGTQQGARNALTGIIIALVVGVGIAVAAAVPMISMGGTSCFSPSLPVRCPPNGRIVIDGQEGTFSETAVVAGPNCTVEIRNSKISAPWVVQGEGNAKITVSNSTLQGSFVGIDGGANAKIRLENNSTVTGQVAAISSGGNGRVTIINSKVQSPSVGIKAEGNADIEATSSHIEGGQYSVKGEGNMELTLIQSKTVGPREKGPNGQIREY